MSLEIKVKERTPSNAFPSKEIHRLTRRIKTLMDNLDRFPNAAKTWKDAIKKEIKSETKKIFSLVDCL